MNDLTFGNGYPKPDLGFLFWLNLLWSVAIGVRRISMIYAFDWDLMSYLYMECNSKTLHKLPPVHNQRSNGHTGRNE